MSVQNPEHIDARHAQVDSTATFNENQRFNIWHNKSGNWEEKKCSAEWKKKTFVLLLI